MNMGVKEENSEFFRLLTRHLSGEMTPEEASVFKKLLEDDPEKQTLLEEYRTVWEEMGHTREKRSYDLDQEWELLKNKISPAGESGDRVDIQMSPPSRSRSLLYYTYRIAAILIAGVLFVFAWLYASRITSSELVLAEQEPVEILLEDGSKVTLNTDSRLRIPKEFTSADRKVYLRGEAWFEVTPDTHRPFLVVAGDALVEVLGTKFNVNAYRGEQTVEVTVSSGMVALTDRQRHQKEIVLRAGNGGTFDIRNQELTLIEEANPNKISWKTKELYFDHTPLEEVVVIINKAYNTRLVITSPELSSCPITVTFSNQSLEAILNVLELTLDLDISRSGNEIRLNGTGCVE